jgi:16S rRNA (guanine527-N7)-methyltransferase
MKDIDWFASICAANGLKISEDQASLFEKYRSLLVTANKQLNLISRKDEDNFYPNHALNSVSFLFRKELIPDASMVDLGTGGGLPGIPVHIIYRDTRVTFIDSITKKTSALIEILQELGLRTARVVNGRGEELSKKGDFQAHFDYVISRAAGKLDDVAKWSRGFLKDSGTASGETIPSGTLIVLKGGAFEEELKHTRSIKSVASADVIDVTFHGMDEIYNKEKKLVLISYKKAAFRSQN